MDDSASRVVCARRELEDMVPTPWDRVRFLANVSAKRGRAIRLSAVDTSELEQTPCGIWLSYADYDEILYDRGTSEYHIDHNICHEVAHIVLDHDRGDRISGIRTIQHLLPNLDASAIERVMCRSHYDDVQESEAEMFADLLMAGSYSRYRRSAPMTSLWGNRA